MREQVSWKINESHVYASLDIPVDSDKQSALIIISGGNEVRSGSHNCQSQLAQFMCQKGHYVLRYDRRGIGDSEGENAGFANSRDDIAAAIQYLRSRIGSNAKIVAFGNCDAASALLLHHDGLNLQSLILANPWTYDPPQHDPKQNDTPASNPESSAPSQPSAAAIRARYWARIKNPHSVIDLFSGKIDIRKLIKGMMSASKKEEMSDLAQRLSLILSDINIQTDILIADKDSTAMAFISVYDSKDFASARQNDKVKVSTLNSASHSFADPISKSWLYEKLSSLLD